MRQGIAERDQELGERRVVVDVLDLVHVHHQDPALVERGTAQRDQQVVQRHVGGWPLPRVELDTDPAEAEPAQHPVDRNVAGVGQARVVGDLQQRAAEQRQRVDTTGQAHLLGDEVALLRCQGRDPADQDGLADPRVAEERPPPLPLAAEPSRPESVPPVGELRVPPGPDLRDPVAAGLERVRRRGAQITLPAAVTLGVDNVIAPACRGLVRLLMPRCRPAAHAAVSSGCCGGPDVSRAPR